MAVAASIPTRCPTPPTTDRSVLSRRRFDQLYPWRRQSPRRAHQLVAEGRTGVEIARMTVRSFRELGSVSVGLDDLARHRHVRNASELPVRMPAVPTCIPNRSVLAKVGRPRGMLVESLAAADFNHAGRGGTYYR